ncbi:MAG: hypothetical protein H0T82_01630, partial [Sphingomonas sp.]|nr:hypothetical protein [Sphingomonas sp.]
MFSAPVQAQDTLTAQDPPQASAARNRAVLTLEEARAMARGDQPAIAAFAREAIASEEEAVAARSLPDLQVSVGIQNFPITGDTAFSPTDDFMT